MPAAGKKVGLNRLRKNPWGCHPEEPQATKDLYSCLILQTAEILRFAQNDRLQGFFRSLLSRKNADSWLLNASH
jgi:hypothetical protein